MKTYQIYVKENGQEATNCTTVQGTIEDATRKMLDVYQRHFDQNYFPNEDLTEATDSDGDVIWEKGENQIGTIDVNVGFYEC